MAAIVRCPICKKVVSSDSLEMPFCSERCRIIDLGNWASDKYSIPVTDSDSELEEAEDPEPFEGSHR